MKRDARMAWYMSASRRPALLQRESLIKLHAIVYPSASTIIIKSPGVETIQELTGKLHVTIPSNFKIGKVSPGDMVSTFQNKDVLSLVNGTPEQIKSTYCIIHVDGWAWGLEYQDDKLVMIALNPTNKQAFDVYDFLIVQKGDIENFPGNKFATTCGRYLINYYLIASTFVRKEEDLLQGLEDLAFINDKVSISKLESILGRLLIDKKIQVNQCNQYVDHGYFLSSVGELYGAVMSKKSITPNPEIKKLKSKLLEKYKDNLQDPRIGSIIENEVIAADKEYMKKDPAMAFLGDSGKKFNIHRKRQYLSVGLLEDFDSTKGSYSYIQESLSEGLDPKSFTVICNEIRKGSYDRGVETQVAGLDTKWMMAVFQNCRITATDCGTSNALTVTINELTATSYFGAYIQTDSQLFDKLKFMDFPKEEVEAFKDQDHLYTVRTTDSDNYKVGDLINTPWKKIYLINSRKVYDDINECPLSNLYTPEQLKKLSGKTIVIFRLSELDIKSKYTPLTKDNYRAYLNKPIKIRSMQYCQQADGFCEICAGKTFQDLDFENVGTISIDVGADFLKIPMAAMHGTKVETFDVSLEDLEEYVVT